MKTRTIGHARTEPSIARSPTRPPRATAPGALAAIHVLKATMTTKMPVSRGSFKKRRKPSGGTVIVTPSACCSRVAVLP